MKETNLDYLKKLSEDTIKKWEASGLLDGLKGHVKENVAELYQCCKSYTIPYDLPIAKRVINQMMDNQPIGDLKTDLSEGL